MSLENKTPPKVMKPRIAVRATNIIITRPTLAHEKMIQRIKWDVSVWEKRGSATWPRWGAWLEQGTPGKNDALRIPRSVDLRKLISQLPGHKPVRINNRWPTIESSIGIENFRSSEYPYRGDDQERLVKVILKKDPNSGKMPGYTLISSSTAGGKTYAALRAWCMLEVPLFGLFSLEEHRTNFLNELKKFVFIKDEKILLTDGTKNLKRDLEKPPGTYDVILMINKTAGSDFKKTSGGNMDDYNKIQGLPDYLKLARKQGVGLLVIDEAHLDLQSFAATLLLSNFLSTVLLTATAFRTDYREDLLFQKLLPPNNARVIEVKKPRLKTTVLHFNSTPRDKDIKECENAQMDYFSPPKFADYLMMPSVWRRWFPVVVGLIQKECIDKNRQGSIILGGKLDIIKKMKRELEKAFPDKTFGNYTSLVKKSIREKELQCDIILTTEKSFAGSVNPLQLEVMIFCAPVASPVLLEQISGRLRGQGNRPAEFFDLACDKGFPRLSIQAKQRERIIKKLSISFEKKDLGVI